jgi:hypothetical protein
VFLKAGLAVNKEVLKEEYIFKYLPSVLHKFIEKQHKNEKIVFWPDLASTLYTLRTDTLVPLEELKIEYVPKKENPQNDPQIRPTKNF